MIQRPTVCDCNIPASVIHQKSSPENPWPYEGVLVCLVVTVVFNGTCRGPTQLFVCVLAPNEMVQDVTTLLDCISLK